MRDGLSLGGSSVAVRQESDTQVRAEAAVVVRSATRAPLAGTTRSLRVQICKSMRRGHLAMKR